MQLKRREALTARTLAISLVVATISVAALACDPGISVTFENQTDHEIRVSVVDDPDRAGGFDAVASGATRTLSYLTRNPEVFRVVIVDGIGNTLLNDIFTIDELEARDFRFVIRPEGIGSE